MSDPAVRESREEPQFGVVLDLDNALTDWEQGNAELIQSVTPRETARFALSRLREPEVFELLNTYYFQVRSAFLYFGESAGLAAAMQKGRRTLYNAAAALAALHLRTGAAFVPGWIGATRARLLPLISGAFPKAAEVNIEFDFAPRLKLRAMAGPAVRVSAFVREVYLHFNICLCSLLPQMEEATPEEREELLLRMMLPYFIQMNDFVPVSRLPQMAALNRDCLAQAQLGTSFQMLFLFGHEYGHLHLGHETQDVHDADTALRCEFEADRFAFKEVGKGVSQEDFQLFFPFVKWIFQIQQIDEIVGGMLRGREKTIEQTSFDQRKNELYALYGEVTHGRLSRDANLFEVGGTALLMELKHTILHLGREKLRRIRDEVTQELTPDRTPGKWWEELK